jgi:hypothetical protein
VTGEFVEETGDRGRNTVSQEGHQSLTSSDDEVPEPELRFVQYQASADREEIERSQLDPSIAEDLEEEARRQFEAENTERESVEIAEEHELVVPQGRVDRHHQTESDQESYEDDDMQEEEEEENVNTRYWIEEVDKISDQIILQI